MNSKSPFMKLLQLCLIISLLTVMGSSFVLAAGAGNAYLTWDDGSTGSKSLIIGEGLDAELYMAGYGSYNYIVTLTQTSGTLAFHSIDSDSFSLGSSRRYNDRNPYSLDSYINSVGDYVLTAGFTDINGNFQVKRLYFTVEPDSDGDGVSDDDDLCEGYDDNIDIDFDFIPDDCDMPSIDWRSLIGSIDANEAEWYQKSFTGLTGDGSETLGFVVEHDRFSAKSKNVASHIDSLTTRIVGQSLLVEFTPEHTFISHEDFDVSDSVASLEDEFEIHITVFEDNNANGQLDSRELSREYTVSATVTDVNQDTEMTGDNACTLSISEGELLEFDFSAKDDDDDDISFEFEGSVPSWATITNTAEGEATLRLDLEGNYEVYDPSSYQYSFNVVAYDYYPDTSSLAAQSRRDPDRYNCAITVEDASVGVELTLPSDQVVYEETRFVDVGSYIDLDDSGSSITVTMTDDAGQDMIMNDDGSGNLDFLWEVPDESEADYTFTVEAVDSDGFSASGSFTLTVEENDRDADSVIDADDNCPDDYNPDQSDIDADLFGDVCDAITLSSISDMTIKEGDSDVAVAISDLHEGPSSESTAYLVYYDSVSDEGQNVGSHIIYSDSLSSGVFTIDIAALHSFVEHSNYPNLEDEFEVTVVAFEDNDVDGELDEGIEHSDSETFTVEVIDVNQDPDQTGSCEISLAEESSSSFDLNTIVLDDDNDDLTFTIDGSSSLESWMTLNVDGTIDFELIGNDEAHDFGPDYHFDIEITDYYPGTASATGGSAMISCMVKVSDSITPANNAPEVEVFDGSTTLIFEEGETIDTAFWYQDIDGFSDIAHVTLVEHTATPFLGSFRDLGNIGDIDSDGVIEGSFELSYSIPSDGSAVGDYVVELIAKDSSGSTGSEMLKITILAVESEEEEEEKEEVEESDESDSGRGPDKDTDSAKSTGDTDTQVDEPVDDTTKEATNNVPVLTVQGAEVEAGESVTISYEAFDEEDGYIRIDVQFEGLDSDAIFEHSNSQSSFTWQTACEDIGVHSITATVKDSDNNTVQESFSITVIDSDGSCTIGNGRFTYSHIGYEERHLRAGDRVYLSINMENSGSEHYEDLQVHVTAMDFGQQIVSPRFDFPAQSQMTQGVYLDIPRYMHEGFYYLRIVTSNDDVEFVTHRTIRVTK